jgi:dihydrofolate synthase/folylpolyglutamate synthase
MELKSMREWEAIRQDYAQKPIQLGLERVVQVWQALGGKRLGFVIAVGGTNGKGSCSSMLDSILRAADYKVGLYTSPHLLSFCERIRINGNPVGEADLDSVFHRTILAEGADSLTQFELDTLVAIGLMNDAGVDVAVLEVGLGGRMDAVNIFDADCAIVASVDFDHMDYLGETREQIGFEKAGIFRGGKPAICGEANTPNSVLAYAAEIGAHLQRIGDDFGYTAIDPAHWQFWNRSGHSAILPNPALQGHYQLNNAAACIAALESIKADIPVAHEAICQGLQTVKVPGRFQVLSSKPEVILDVAHNPHAARSLADNLRSIPAGGRTLGVFAMLADKDIAGVVQALGGQIDAWFVAGIQQVRGAPASVLQAILAKEAPSAEVRTFSDVKAAFQQARLSAKEDDRIIVFGSFYTVADVLRVFALNP